MTGTTLPREKCAPQVRILQRLASIATQSSAVPLASETSAKILGIRRLISWKIHGETFVSNPQVWRFPMVSATSSNDPILAGQRNTNDCPLAWRVLHITSPRSFPPWHPRRCSHPIPSGKCQTQPEKFGVHGCPSGDHTKQLPGCQSTALLPSQ